MCSAYNCGDRGGRRGQGDVLLHRLRTREGRRLGTRPQDPVPVQLLLSEDEFALEGETRWLQYEIISPANSCPPPPAPAPPANSCPPSVSSCPPCQLLSPASSCPPPALVWSRPWSSCWRFSERLRNLQHEASSRRKDIPCRYVILAPPVTVSISWTLCC